MKFIGFTDFEFPDIQPFPQGHNLGKKTVLTKENTYLITDGPFFLYMHLLRHLSGEKHRNPPPHNKLALLSWRANHGFPVKYIDGLVLEGGQDHDMIVVCRDFSTWLLQFNPHLTQEKIDRFMQPMIRTTYERRKTIKNFPVEPLKTLLPLSVW